MSAHAWCTFFRTTRAVAVGMSVILFTRKHKSQRSAGSGRRLRIRFSVWACLCAVERIANGCRVKWNISSLQDPHMCGMPFAPAYVRGARLLGQPKKKKNRKNGHMVVLEVEVGCGRVSSFGLYASTVKSFLTCHEQHGVQGLWLRLCPKWP